MGIEIKQMGECNTAESFQMNFCKSAGREVWLEKAKILKRGLEMLENSWINQWMLIKQNFGDCVWSASCVSDADNLLRDTKEGRKVAVPSARTVWGWASLSDICPDPNGGLSLFQKWREKKGFRGVRKVAILSADGNLLRNKYTRRI